MHCNITDVFQTSINETNKMFDHFFIFGKAYECQSNINSKNCQDTPSLLCAYPSTENKETQEELKQISTFCFPDGFTKLNPSKDDISSIKIIDKFAYFFKESLQKAYVTCVKFSLYNENSVFFVNKMNKHYPFCMCMISKVPCISKHIKFMTKLIYIIFGKLMPHQNLPAIPKISHVCGLCYPSLIFDKSFLSIAVQKGMKAPKIFLRELLYYENQIYTLPKSILPNQYLLYPTMHALLSFLSVEKLVKIYTAVMLERKILFVSKSASKYSSTVIALSSLSSYFNTISLILPIVPKEFAILLDSPVPYIAGSSFYNNNADIIVDLDQNLFITKENDPNLPSQDELIKKLECLAKYEKDSIQIPDKTVKTIFNTEKINPKFMDFVENIDDNTYPICQIEDLKILVNSGITDLVKIVFDGHIIPRLASFGESLKKLNYQVEPTDIMKNNYSSDLNFYHDFFSTQCGSFLYDKYKDNMIDLLKLL